MFEEAPLKEGSFLNFVWFDVQPNFPYLTEVHMDFFLNVFSIPRL